MHWRDKKLVTDWPSLKVQVRRWQGTAQLNWSDEDIDDVARFLNDTYDFETRKKMLARPEGRDPGIWKAISTELGLTCAPFAEEYGGMGGGHLENAIMMEELGKVIAIEPYLQTVVIGGGAMKRAQENGNGAMADAVIPEIIAGNATIAFAYAEPQGRYDLADIGIARFMIADIAADEAARA